MSDWNLDRLRKIAGLNESAKSESKVLNERWENEDDDYDDPDVKVAMKDKRQKEFERTNKKELDDNAEMMRKRTEEQRKAAEEKKAAKAAKPAEKKEEKPAPKAEEKKPESKPAEKKEEKPAPKAEAKPEPKAEEKPAEKKEETKAEEKAAEEKKRRGKAPNPGSKAQRALAKLKTMTRGEFIKWAAEELEMGKNYASAYYARHNPKSSREQKVTEAKVLWGLAHPFLKGFVLAENRELNQMQWIDADSKLEPMLFISEAEAQKIAKHMSEWKSQTAVVESYDFSEMNESEDQKKNY